MDRQGTEKKLVRRLGQVAVPSETRSDVSTHGLWKHRTTTMFDIRIFNLNASSYLCMTPVKDLEKVEKNQQNLYLQA